MLKGEKSMSNEMDELEQMWGAATTESRQTGEFENLPDGKYQAKIESIRFGHTKEKGLPMFSWDLILVSSHAGRHIFHNRVMSSADNVKYAKQDFTNVGLHANSINELTDKLDEILDAVIEIQLKTKGQYQNCYINKVVSKPLGHEVNMDPNDQPF